MNELEDWNPFDAYRMGLDKIAELLWKPYLLGKYRDNIGMLIKADDETETIS